MVEEFLEDIIKVSERRPGQDIMDALCQQAVLAKELNEGLAEVKRLVDYAILVEVGYEVDGGLVVAAARAERGQERKLRELECRILRECERVDNCWEGCLDVGRRLKRDLRASEDKCSGGKAG